MKKNLGQIFAAFLTIIGAMGLAAITALPSAASTPYMQIADVAIDKAKEGVTAVGGGDNSTSLTDLIKSVINILLYIGGVIAVIMIIIGGIKYITSNGDTGQVTSAKNTIMYAIIGLVVAIIAFAIVNWVIESISGK
ncbi:MAG: pilin [Candidatus Saccharimonadales bacterium]